MLISLSSLLFAMKSNVPYSTSGSGIKGNLWDFAGGSVGVERGIPH